MTAVPHRTGTASGEAAAGWESCGHCRVLLYGRRLRRSGWVCPDCGWHRPLTALQRMNWIFDAGSRTDIESPAVVQDPLGFVDRMPYPQRLAEARTATGMTDAVLVAAGTVAGHRAVAAVMDFRFLGGSLGVAAGEAVTVAAEAALARRVPLLLVTASGGARMQEGVLALMQMAKTSAAMAALDEAGLLTVTVVTDPTYGGVAASFATLSDVVLAEPRARMGFAGPRVIRQTMRVELPTGFQTAEFLLERGLIDDVRPRTELRQVLAHLLATADRPESGWRCDRPDPVLRDHAALPPPVPQVSQVARQLDRPTTLDHIGHWTESFVELRGDRTGQDCPAIVGGLAMLDGQPVVIVGHQKGHTPAELTRRRFGMASPAGYRKCRRLMQLAGKLGVPLVTLVDTVGAYPGVTAEEQGQAGAIADCLRTLAGLPVPVVAVVTGEGGSGGALALAVADQVLMCANATYSVISPEGCAAILWKTAAATAAATAALRIDARSLLALGVIDGVIPEPPGGAHSDPERASALVRDAVVHALRPLCGRDPAELVSARQARIRGHGRATTPFTGSPTFTDSAAVITA